MPRLNKFAADVVVLGALFVALIFAIRHGVEKGTDFWYGLALVVGLSVVAIGEYLFWHSAACAWFERRIGSLLTCTALGCILTFGVIYTNFSSSAANNDARHGVQKAKLTTQGDVGASIKELETEVARLQEAASNHPKRNAEQAQIAIDKAKAHRWWKATDECTTTLGPQTRTYCDEYRAAQADLKAAPDAARDRRDLASAREKLEGLRGQRSLVHQAATSEENPAVLLLAKYTSASTEEARQLDSMVVPFMMQALLLLGGVVKASEHYRDRPRVPWINWARIAHGVACVVATFKGQPLPVPSTVHNHVVIEATDDRFRADVADLLGSYKGSLPSLKVAA